MLFFKVSLSIFIFRKKRKLSSNMKLQNQPQKFLKDSADFVRLVKFTSLFFYSTLRWSWKMVHFCIEKEEGERCNPGWDIRKSTQKETAKPQNAKL